MSVAKWGGDTAGCGRASRRHPPRRDLPARRRRHHGRRRRRERQRQRRGARPGRVRRGHHRLGARRQRRQAGRARWQPLLLVGHLRQRRHVRQLQQLRLRRRHHRARQVHLLDRAGRPRLLVRDVDGGPHVTGAAALVKAVRPYFTPAEVKEALQYLGHPRLEGHERSGLRPTSGCSTCPGSGRAATSRCAMPDVPTVSTSGGTINFTVDARPGRTRQFERIALQLGAPAAGRPRHVRRQEPLRLRGPARRR